MVRATGRDGAFGETARAGRPDGGEPRVGGREIRGPAFGRPPIQEGSDQQRLGRALVRPRGKACPSDGGRGYSRRGGDPLPGRNSAAARRPQGRPSRQSNLFWS